MPLVANSCNPEVRWERSDYRASEVGSSSQEVPRAVIMRACHEDHGSRSRRAGMSVLISFGISDLDGDLGILWKNADAAVTFEDGVVDVVNVSDTCRASCGLNILTT